MSRSSNALHEYSYGAALPRRPRRAWRRLAIAAALIGSCLATQAHAEDEAVIQVEFPNIETRDAFLLEFPETKVRTERRIVRPELRVTMPALTEIQRRGYPLRIVLMDMDKSGETTLPQPPHNNIETSHYTFEEHIDSLQALADRYPTLTRSILLGTSPQNRPICALKISDNPQVDEDEPVMLLAATTHADEDVGVDITMQFMSDLLSNYGVEPEATAMVNGGEIWVVPLLNPDGWALLESGEVSDWRKNTRDNNGNQDFDSGDGVDLNRNYSFNWEFGPAAPSTLPTYRGPFPFSEPEAGLLRDLMDAIRPTIALTYHQWGDVVVIPWRWNGLATPDSVTYRAIASRLAATVTNLSGTPYPWYEDNQTAGFMDDWLYGTQGGFCFTIEVSTTNLSTVPVAVANNQGGIYQAWGELNGPQITGRVLSLDTGLPVATKIEVLEINTSALVTRTSDPGTGRFRRLLAPGSYTLRVTAPGFVPATLPFSTSSAGPTVMDVFLVRDSTVTTAVAPNAPRSAMRLASHPNPARGRVRVEFDPGAAGRVRLELHDLSGRRVRTLMDGQGSAGWSRVDWDGTDDRGGRLPAGVYLLRLSTAGLVESRRMVWLD